MGNVTSSATKRNLVLRKVYEEQRTRRDELGSRWIADSGYCRIFLQQVSARRPPTLETIASTVSK